jgi:hypothetical protein
MQTFGFPLEWSEGLPVAPVMPVEDDKQLTLPNQLIIGPITYAVAEEPRLKEEGLYARIRFTEAVIELATPMDWEVARVHLLHEIIHAIMTNAGIAHDDQEERIVHCMAAGIVAFHNDNPDFFN